VALPEPVKSFWYAMAELGQASERTPWGVVQTDARFPLVWDVNQASVMEPDPSVTTDHIRSALHPALRQAGALHEHVEFWETSAESPALRDFRSRGDRFDPDAVMVLEEEAFEAGTPAISVEGVTTPPPDFWPWYRRSLHEFQTPLTDGVLDQMVDRVRHVLLPGGIRWFIGNVGGSMAGYASLISLAEVGYLDQVVTMPEFRGRGVATACVTSAVRAGLDEGAQAVFLLTEEGGAPQRLYEKLGFRARARIESFTRRLDDR
jgi:ribosomal protein S18 acetylase RimI-like enzyme